MSAFERFDADAAMRAILARGPAKPAKAAKEEPEHSDFRDFRNFSSPPPSRADVREGADERRAWCDELMRDLHGWLSVHPPDAWRAARVGERIQPHMHRLETLLLDYEATGEPGDRKAAVFAANAVAATAGRAVKEWRNRRGRRQGERR